MFVSRLKLTDFRNYSSANLSFSKECVFFRGENAQGKTNLLEAIYICSTGRSHRTADNRDLIRMEASDAAVKLMAERLEGRQTIDIKLHRTTRQDIYVNGIKTRRLGELMGHFNCVMFAPEDLNLVKEGPAFRRRFLDMELSQLKPSYFYGLQRYAKALKQRNALLKEIRERPRLIRTLPSWNEQLAASGCKILAERREFCEKLAILARESHLDLSGGKEILSVRYEPGISEAAENEAIYANELEKRQEDDIRRGTTLTGVHRDDIALEIGGSDIRAFGSQGQQRTAAVALKLSELSFIRDVTGQWPVLLLDDVLSELDKSRQALLISRISGVQTFITGTTATMLPKGFAREISIIDGRVC